VETEATGPSLVSRLIAVVVLLVAGWILLKVVIGVVSAIAWTAVAIAAVIAVLWAAKTLFW
jgi:uncharacterized membrane protein YccC